MNVTLGDGSALMTEAATIEGQMLADLRWLISPRSDAERILQQAVRMQRGSECWIEWRAVPEVVGDLP